MINAYGRAGAVYEAFNCVDEMMTNKIKPTTDTLNNILCACIGDSNNGFKYALSAWQLCLKHKITPDLYSYNLLLRATRDCNINTEKMLPKPKNKAHKPLKLKNKEENLFPINSDEYKIFKHSENEMITANTQPNVNKSLESSKNVNLEKAEKTELIELKKEDVHVIDELKVVGKSLEGQIKNLKWWQEIKPNIDKVELVKDLSKWAFFLLISSIRFFCLVFFF